jgi:glycine oxidase
MPAKGGTVPYTHDVAVVGGGIIGLSCAWACARRGLRTVVLERGKTPGVATHAAAGMLAPVTEAAFGEEDLLRAGVESARCYPAWAAELGVPLHEPGALMVARDRDEAEALERELAFRVELGLPVERLLPSRARRLEPALAPTIRLALDVPGDHAVDPRALVAALATRVEVRRGEVDRLELPGGVVLAGGGRVEAEWIVIAAGAWAGGVRDGVPVRPVKGQILRLRDPAGPGAVERVLRMADGYLVPRGDGRYVLGATMEERGWDTAVTAGGVHELLHDAMELVPGISEWVLEESTAGLRPATPDNLPAVGPGWEPGLVWAVGHGRNGVLLAPLTGELVAAVVDGDEPHLGALDPRRFMAVRA